MLLVLSAFLTARLQAPFKVSPLPPAERLGVCWTEVVFNLDDALGSFGLIALHWSLGDAHWDALGPPWLGPLPAALAGAAPSRPPGHPRRQLLTPPLSSGVCTHLGRMLTIRAALPRPLLRAPPAAEVQVADVYCSPAKHTGTRLSCLCLPQKLLVVVGR